MPELTINYIKIDIEKVQNIINIKCLREILLLKQERASTKG